MASSRQLRSRRWAGLAVALAGIAPVILSGAPAQAATAGCPAPASRLIASPGIDAFSVALDGKGGFYLTSATGELSRINIATGASRTIATGLGNLRGVVSDGKGTVYVADFGGRVLAVNTATGRSSVLAQGLGTVLGVTFSKGKVYASGSGANDTLWEITPGSSPRAVAQGMNNVSDIAADDKGGIAVVELTGAVYRIDIRTGARQTFTTPGDLYEPISVQVSADGRIVFATGASELHTVDPVTGVISEPCTSTSAHDFALDNQGNAVVLSLSDGKISYVRHLLG
jgi:streptogramin lyase